MHGIYHTDIKPHNIVFYRHPELDGYEPKLIDFAGAVTDYSKIIYYSSFYFFNERSRKSK